MSDLDIRAPAEEGEGTRLQVLRWLKQVGESVAQDEPLIEIETDKVTVEVASPGAGVLREILRQENDEVAPGELLGRIESGVAAHTPAGAGATAQAAALAAPPAARAAAGAASGAVALSPAVRRLLAERGLDSSQVRGTGEGGRVTVDDVLNSASREGAPIPSSAPVVASPQSVAAPEPGVRRVPSHPDPQAHRRASDTEPAAHCPARHDGVRGRPGRSARAPHAPA